MLTRITISVTYSNVRPRLEARPDRKKKITGLSLPFEHVDYSRISVRVPLKTPCIYYETYISIGVTVPLYPKSVTS